MHDLYELKIVLGNEAIFNCARDIPLLINSERNTLSAAYWLMQDLQNLVYYWWLTEENLGKADAEDLVEDFGI